MMTVTQMADRARKHGDEQEPFIQRLRHWTRERLLFPLGETNPGTGKHRVYDEDALHDALLLDALTSTGVPIARQRVVISKVQEQRQQWRIGRRKENEPDLLLVIEIYPWGSQPYFVEGQYTTDRRLKHVIVFNLTSLFKVLQPPPATMSLTSSTPIVSVTTSKKRKK